MGAVQQLLLAEAAAGGGPWLPSQLATLKLWLKGNELTGTNGSTIATFPDASGLGNNATQVTSGNRPTLAVANQNGLNVVRFSAAGNQYFALPNAFSAFTEGAVMFVARVITDPPGGDGSAGAPFKFGTSSGGNQNNHYPYSDGNIYDDFGSNTRKTVGNPTSSLASYHIGGFRSKASDYRYFLNGTQFFSTATNTAAWNTSPTMGGFAFGGLVFLDGYVGEAVLLNEFASTSDWQKLEGYLAWKWGIQSVLPGGHPYASAPP